MIGVLVSGEGTNLQALLDAELPVVAVASNNTKAKALDRASKAGIEAGAFPTVEFDSRERRDEELAEWLAERGVELVVLARYMQVLSGRFVEARTTTSCFGSNPSISTRSWLSVCSRSSLPPPRPANRWRPTASISST